MESFKGGKTRPDRVKRKESVAKESVESELPRRIEVKYAGLIKGVVPSHVWRQPPFRWQPSTFVVESEKLNSKFIEDDTQNESLLMFMKDPTLPLTYGVAGNPDDAKAKYFAAYLVSLHLRHLGAKANVIWHPVYEGFQNSLLEDDSKPTMIVLTNVTPNATQLRLSKIRDVIEKFPDIPIVMVIAGMDPLSYFTTRLYSPINALVYFSEALIKKVEYLG